MGDIDIQVQPDIADPDLAASRGSDRRSRRHRPTPRPRSPASSPDSSDSSRSPSPARVNMPSGEAARSAENAAAGVASSFYNIKTVLIVAVVVVVLCVLGFIAYKWFSHKPEVAAVSPTSASPSPPRPSPSSRPRAPQPPIVSGQMPIPPPPASPKSAPTHESLVKNASPTTLMQTLAAINSKKQADATPSQPAPQTVPEPPTEHPVSSPDVSQSDHKPTDDMPVDEPIVAAVVIIDAGPVDTNSVGADGQPKVQEISDAGVSPPAAPATTARCTKILDNHRQCAKRATTGGRCHFHQGT